jgi:hypothetical protein
MSRARHRREYTVFTALSLLRPHNIHNTDPFGYDNVALDMSYFEKFRAPHYTEYWILS